MNRFFRIVLVIPIVSGCTARTTPPAPPFESSPEQVGIHNLHQVGNGLWSGSVPEGDDGFRALSNMGVRTIVSVDVGTPDVERARRFGLRYVHVPVGYGGITREQQLRLARAAELPGPIYVHCHHGLHRGPTAAALIHRCQEPASSAEVSLAFLKLAGTDPKYEGLYAAVRDFRLPTGNEMQTVPATLPEVAEVGGLAARMVEIDADWARLKRYRADVWPIKGDSDAPHLALQLREGFREAGRLPDAATRPETFRQQLADSERLAGELETSLRKGDAASATRAFDKLAANCTACHREHRDQQR